MLCHAFSGLAKSREEMNRKSVITIRGLERISKCVSDVEKSRLYSEAYILLKKFRGPMYYFPYIVVSDTPSSAQIKLESKRTQIPLCICIILVLPGRM